MANVTLRAIGLVSTSDGIIQPGDEFEVDEKQAKKLEADGAATKNAAEAKKATEPDDPDAIEAERVQREQIDRNLIAPAPVDQADEDGNVGDPDETEPQAPPVEQPAKRAAAKKAS